MQEISVIRTRKSAFCSKFRRNHRLAKGNTRDQTQFDLAPLTLEWREPFGCASASDRLMIDVKLLDC